MSELIKVKFNGIFESVKIDLRISLEGFIPRNNQYFYKPVMTAPRDISSSPAGASVITGIVTGISLPGLGVVVAAPLSQVNP